MAEATIDNIVHVSEIPPDDQRNPTTLYIVPEPVTERDQALGSFMDAWGHLEQALLVLFWELLDSDYDKAAAIYLNASNFKQQREIISSISEVVCDQEEQRQIRTLLERCGRFATKRNRIVHGAWIPNSLIGADKLGRPEVLKTDWKRTVMHPSAEKRESITNDSSLQNEYWFSIADISRIRNDIVALVPDVHTLISRRQAAKAIEKADEGSE